MVLFFVGNPGVARLELRCICFPIQVPLSCVLVLTIQRFKVLFDVFSVFLMGTPFP